MCQTNQFDISRGELASGESPLTCEALRLLDESTRKLSAELDLLTANIYNIQCTGGISFSDIAYLKGDRDVTFQLTDLYDSNILAKLVQT
jgi:hypothetical protein